MSPALILVTCSTFSIYLFITIVKINIDYFPKQI
jgi:hypothetical protein